MPEPREEYTCLDGWTVITADRKPSAHFEHNIAVVNGKPEILSTFNFIENP